MKKRHLMIAAGLLAMTFSAAGCNRDSGTPAASSSADKKAKPAGTVGGPGATSGGITGDPLGGTPGGAATASTPEGPAPGAGIAKTDGGGTAGDGIPGPASRPAATTQ